MFQRVEKLHPSQFLQKEIGSECSMDSQTLCQTAIASQIQKNKQSKGENQEENELEISKEKN
jgi:hypothetical protein